MQSLNGFLAFLDGLALPHRASVRDLRTRYGATVSKYYRWDVVEAVDAKPIVDGQVGSFYFTCNNDPDLLPPMSFSAFIAADADVHKNHWATLNALSALFGQTATDKSVSNTLGHVWRFETAALEIVSWPPELNRRHTNPAIARHPELANFCHLRLTNGYLPPLTPQEAGWLKELTPFANPGSSALPRTKRIDPLWNGVDRGLHRYLPAETRGRGGALGKSRDGRALAGIDDTEAFVLARADIRAVALHHIAPSKGPGGSALSIGYADRFSTDQGNRELPIFAAPKIHALDLMADEIAAWAEVDVKHAEYGDD